MNSEFYLAACLLLAPTLAQLRGATFFGPTPYLSTNDIPAGLYVSGKPTVLEDFEDGTLDPSIKASTGQVVGPGGLTDSVDADDGAIDGSGTNGHSWFTDNAFAGIKFTFPPGTIAAGLVWTDGIDPVTFAAFGPGNVPLGTNGPIGGFADGSYAGTTAEDRFFGVRDAGGVESIFINGNGGGIEVDHVQYELGGPVTTQDFVIDWYNIGPGGMSAGGNFALSGGISQPAGASALTGGDFTLDSDFWGIVPEGGPGAATFDRNLILNPSAELGAGSISANDILRVPNWTTTGNFTVVVYDSALPSPGVSFGQNYFVGGPATRTDASNPFSSATQMIDVSALAPQIDGATVIAELGGYFGGFGEQNDRASLTATYLNGSGNSLGNVFIGNVLAADRTNHTALLYRGGTNAVPAGTRNIQLVLAMTNEAGAYYNDGYADALTLVLRSHENTSATIFDNTTGSDNGFIGFTETTWLASKFCLGSQAFSLDSVSLLLDSQDFSGQANPPSSVRLQIYAADPVSGKPSASTGPIMILSGLTNPITPQPRGYGLVKWTPATPFRLAPNTCYWAVLSREGGGTIAETASFSMPTGAAATIGKAQSNDAGATWGIDESFNFKMLIQGTAYSGPSPSADVVVPGTANPWLAGMTNGFADPSGDATPANSPVLFSGFDAGMKLQFSVPDTDRAGYQPGSESGPDGVPGFFVTHGAELGIGEIRGAQANALLGVFLNDSQPGANPTPLPLDFTADAARNYLELEPELNQPFYIGNGRTTDEIAQTVIPPAGATRLFLGITDGSGWYNNSGAFHVSVTVTTISTPVLTPELAANSSTPIPGGSGSFTTLPFAPALSGDNLVFYGGGSNGQQGIYSLVRVSQTPTRIADLNTPIPNGAGNFLSFGTEAGIIIVGGDVLFKGRGSGVQQGLYLAPHSAPANLLQVADSSTAIPNGAGTFTEFPNAPAFNGNEISFVASGSGGHQGIYKATVLSPPQIGPPQLIADTTMAIPGGNGNFTAFPSGPALTGGGVAFIANGSAGQQGIYKIAVLAPPQIGSPLPIADTATPIPGGVGNFTAFGPDQAHPIDPAASGDRLAFVGSGSGGQQGLYTVGVLAPPQSGPLRLADTSIAIPEGQGNFASFGAVGISDTDVAFLAGGPNGQQGIYAATARNKPFKVIDLNDKISGKSIAGLNFSRAGLFGDPITFQATFTDGSEGIYTMNIVAPSPALRITQVKISGSDLLLNFSSAAGETYVVQSSIDIAASEWSDITGDIIIGTGEAVQVTIPQAFAQPQRFYKLKVLP